MKTLEELKYPIGEFDYSTRFGEKEYKKALEELERFPIELEKVCSTLSKEQLKWIYRPDGWSIQQVVHHCADSHMNSFIRCKLAATESNPLIKPYKEDLWAMLPDTVDYPIEESIALLKLLHKRWVYFFRTANFHEMRGMYRNPESRKQISVVQTALLYAWHSKHHLAHIKLAIESEGDFN